MDLDDLQRRWADQDCKLDAGLRLNARLLRTYTSNLGKAETALRRLTWLLGIGLIFDFLIVLWLGSFAADHAADARFLIPAVMLGAGVIALAIAAVRQLAAIGQLGQLDYGQPIVELQRRLESLRLQRTRETQITMLLSPLAWIPLLIVGLKGLLGVDAYTFSDGRWLAANVLFGLAVIPLALWAARRYADRLEGSPLAQRLARDLAGYNVNAAAGFLSALARFEQEEPGPAR
jgi:hypothetical protein